jgi:leucyl aminopeptidase
VDGRPLNSPPLRDHDFEEAPVPTFDVITSPAIDQEAELLIVPVYQGPEPGPGVKEVDRALGASVIETLRDNGVTGKVNEFFSLPTYGRLKAKTVLVIGLGPKKEVDDDRIRRTAGHLARWASRYGSAVTTLPQAARGGAEESVHAFVEGLLLGSYRFMKYKSEPDGDGRRLERVVIAGAPKWNAKALLKTVERATVYAESAMWARDLVNTPAGDATPDYLAREATRMANEVGLEVKVWKKADLEKGGFGGILGVGQGSVNEPRFIELRYAGGGKNEAPIAITGKGITFDSGGLSIKPADQMEWMKSDMGGAAAVLAAMRAIAILKPKANLIAAIPSSENLPSGAALRPGDVITHHGGKTSEVLNTDAEGRLVLADALAFLAEQKPQLILDAATLTGACMVALGEDLWGIMGNDRRLIREILDAGDQVGEPGWELPLWRQYKRHIDSPIADVKNIGLRYGGAIHAALFLAEFVGDTPWAHMDVAGTAFHQKEGDYWGRGATGNPARTLIRFVENRAARAKPKKAAAR